MGIIGRAVILTLSGIDAEGNEYTKAEELSYIVAKRKFHAIVATVTDGTFLQFVGHTITSVVIYDKADNDVLMRREWDLPCESGSDIEELRRGGYRDEIPEQL